MTKLDTEKTELIKETVEDIKLRWFGHLVEVNAERPAKQVWEAEIQVRNCGGRPHKRWNVIVAGALKKTLREKTLN